MRAKPTSSATDKPPREFSGGLFLFGSPRQVAPGINRATLFFQNCQVHPSTNFRPGPAVALTGSSPGPPPPRASPGPGPAQSAHLVPRPALSRLRETCSAPPVSPSVRTAPCPSSVAGLAWSPTGTISSSPAVVPALSRLGETCPAPPVSPSLRTAPCPSSVAGLAWPPTGMISSSPAVVLALRVQPSPAPPLPPDPPLLGEGRPNAGQ